MKIDKTKLMVKKQYAYWNIIPVATLLIGTLLFCEPTTAQVNSIPEAGSPDKTQFRTLVWSDEFDGTGAVDPDKWFHQTQLPPRGQLVGWYHTTLYRPGGQYISKGRIFKPGGNQGSICRSGRVKAVYLSPTQLQVCLHLWTCGGPSKITLGDGHVAGDLDVEY